MKTQKLLLVEDQEDIASLITLQAKMAGFEILVEQDGLEGYIAIEKEKPNLAILDIMLPSMNGLDICRKIKNHPHLKHIPVIMLSAKGEELDIILGLELGADDYVSKPFSPKILFSRIKAILRRLEEPKIGSNTLVFGDYTMNLDSYLVKRKDKTVSLTLSEFGILRRLLQNKGRVLTRNQLLEDLQSDDVFVIDRNIDVHIASLRKKLGPHFMAIETVRGIGYRFKEEYF